MPNWSVADWVTYPPIIIAALLMAMIQASKDIEQVPTWVPAALKSARWNYAPLILLMISAAAFGAKQIGPRQAPIVKIVKEYVKVPQKIYVPTKILVPTADPKQAATIVDLQKKVESLEDQLRHPASSLLAGIRSQSPPSALMNANPVRGNILLPGQQSTKGNAVPPAQQSLPVAAPPVTGPVRQQPLNLSEADRKSLVAALWKLQPMIPSIQVTYPNWHACMDWMYFMQLFTDAGLNPSRNGENPRGPDETGFMIEVPDTKNPTPAAVALQKTLSVASIVTKFVSRSGTGNGPLTFFCVPQ